MRIGILLLQTPGKSELKAKTVRVSVLRSVRPEVSSVARFEPDPGSSAIRLLPVESHVSMEDVDILVILAAFNCLREFGDFSVAVHVRLASKIIEPEFLCGGRKSQSKESEQEGPDLFVHEPPVAD